MVYVGKTVRKIRESIGLMPERFASMLGVPSAHLALIEDDEVYPDIQFAQRFEDLFGIDIFLAAWCLQGDVDSLPKLAREPARQLTEVWVRKVEEAISRYRHSS